MSSKYVVTFTMLSFSHLVAMEQSSIIKIGEKEAVVRQACQDDVDALSKLIVLSVNGLQAESYTPAQRAAALGTVFGVDTQLIEDKTYYVVQCGSEIIGCGGWSRWKKLFGSDHTLQKENGLLNPTSDPARIRAFFVHPDWARRGIGKALLATCEDAAKRQGFSRFELVATLAGIPLYTVCGFTAGERFEYPLVNGEFLPLVRMSKN